MAFFRVFKKKEISESKKIHFRELEGLIESYKKKINEKIKDLTGDFETILNEYEKKISLNIDSLKKIDIESKKVEEIAKTIVSQSLKKYINSVNNLLLDLRKIQVSALEDFFLKIRKAFGDFEKNSFLDYNRATYLIGKELEETKNNIVKFFEEFELLQKEYEESINEEKKTREISNLVEKTKNIERDISSLNELILKLNQDKKVLLSKVGELNSRKNSKEMIEIKKENEVNEQKINELLAESEKKLKQIVSLVNFKKMSGIFHKSQKQMEKINLLKQNLKEEIFKEEYDEVISCLEEYEKIRSLINEISEIRKEIEEKKKRINYAVFKQIENDISSINYQIKDIEKEIEVEKEKIKNLDKKIEETKSEISKNLRQMGFEVIL